MLLAGGEVLAVAVAKEAGECELAAALGELWETSVSVKGFGASDCRCESHLLYLCREMGEGLRRFRGGLAELEVRMGGEISSLYS